MNEIQHGVIKTEYMNHVGNTVISDRKYKDGGLQTGTLTHTYVSQLVGKVGMKFTFRLLGLFDLFAGSIRLSFETNGYVT